MLVLREKFILGNYICIRLKYPETLFVGTSAGDQGAEMDGDTSERRLVSTHARLITLSLTNIPAHNVTRSHTQICFKKTTKSVFKLLSQQVLNLNLNACCNTWEFAWRRAREGMRRGGIIVDNLRKHGAHSLPLVTRGCRCREGAVCSQCLFLHPPIFYFPPFVQNNTQLISKCNFIFSRNTESLSPQVSQYPRWNKTQYIRTRVTWIPNTWPAQMTSSNHVLRLLTRG